MHIHDYLLQTDAKHNCQIFFPEKFDMEIELNRVILVDQSIKKSLQLITEIDSTAQDAYFFADIKVVHCGPVVQEKTNANSNSLLLRFSNFGNLVSVNDEFFAKNARSDLCVLLKKILVKNNFVPVDTSWLFLKKYDGDSSYFKNNDFPWWFRFFDYA